MLSAKLYVLLNIAAPYGWIFMTEMRSNNFKTACFVKYLGSMNVNICLCSHKNNNNDKRVIGIAQLNLSAVLKGIATLK